MNAIVLAGAKSEGMGKAMPSDAYRAGMIVGGHSLLEQVMTVLHGLPQIKQTVIVGPEALVPAALAGAEVKVLPPGDDLGANLAKGLAALPAEEQVLVIASDLPLLTKSAVGDFLQSCAGREAEIFYPIIRQEVYEAAYPGSRRTYLSTKDGTFTGGNLALLSPAVYQKYRVLIDKAVSSRKHPRRLGALLGWRFSLGLMLRRHTVAEIESRVRTHLGIQAVAVETRFSEIGYDIDSSEDLEWIEFYWGGSLEGSVRDEAEAEE